jgi:GntR family transcriptional regulator
MIQIVTGDARPIFKQIVDGIRMQIMTGQLQVGEKLPSVRGLSMQLTVNTNTVAKAYTELLSLGLVESRKGLGLFVIQPKQILSDQERLTRLQTAVDHLIHETIGLSFSQDEILQMIQSRLDYLQDGENE